MIVFHALSAADLAAIVDLLVAELQRRLAAQDLTLDLTPTARSLIATEGHDPAYGARPLKRAIQRLLENPLAKALLEGRFGPGETIVADADPLSGVLTFTSGTAVVVTEKGAARDARRAARGPETSDERLQRLLEVPGPGPRREGGKRPD